RAHSSSDDQEFAADIDPVCHNCKVGARCRLWRPDPPPFAAGGLPLAHYELDCNQRCVENECLPLPDRTSPLATFRNETFRVICAASLISNFGGLILSVGAAWMMASITSSANMVALVQASTSLPIMLFSVAAGALADNLDRRRLMLTAQRFMLTV